MKKLLALLMSALVLLSMSIPAVWAEDGQSAPEAPAAESHSEPKAPAETQTEPKAPAEAPAEAPAATNPAGEAPAAPAEQSEAPAAPAPEAAPVQATEPAAEAPAAGEEPQAEEPKAEEAAPAEEEPQAEEPKSEETPSADEETDEEAPAEDQLPHDKPRWTKSLKAWEKERASLSLSGDAGEDVLTIARSQLGYSADSTCYEEDKAGRKRYYTRYGDWNGSRFCEWCDAFVSFCVYYAGVENYPLEASCGRHMLYLKRAGYWREWNSYVPRKGDIVFFAMGKNVTAPNHVGLVEEVIPAEGNKPGHLVTIEGNQKNPDGNTPCVRRMVRSLGSVVGYGTYEKGPAYPEAYTVRSNGSWVIDRDSPYFVEEPTREALRFLGLTNSVYYAHWFPEAPDDGETGTAPAVE